MNAKTRVNLHLATIAATTNSPLIIRALAKAAHGKVSDRAMQLLHARRLTIELLDKIDIAGAALDRGEDSAEKNVA